MLSKKRVWDGLDSFANICYNNIYIYILNYISYIIYNDHDVYIYNDNVFVLKTAVPLYENQPIKRGICEWIFQKLEGMTYQSTSVDGT